MNNRHNIYGRKMVVGNLRRDPHTDKLAIFAGYCPSCNDKVFVDKHDLRGFFARYRRDQRKWSVRILESLLRHYDPK